MAKILIIDDSKFTRLEIVQILKSEGFEVLQAEDGQQGVDVAAMHPDIDLFIIDYNLPHLNGFEMLAEMNSRGLGINALKFMLTTESVPELKKKGKTLGIMAWIVKPFAREEMVAAIRMKLAADG